MKCPFLFAIPLCLSGSVIAQNQTSQQTNAGFSYQIDVANIKPLEIGQEVPDISFNMIVDGKKKQGKLSDFRGRPIILDFWNITCPTCIAQFGKYSKIQVQLGEKAVIMPVGFDVNKPGNIENFVLKRKKNGNPIPLPTIVQSPSDTLLLKWFPTRVMPHLVWIDKSGIFKGSTEFNAVTLENILRFSEGNITWKKKTKYYVYPKDEFLIKRSRIPAFGSAFAGYIDSLGSSVWNTLQKQFDSTVVRFYFHNHSVPNMYASVYSIIAKDDFSAANKRILADDYVAAKYKDDTSPGQQLDNWERDKFNRENLYSYELILPSSVSLSEAYRYMVADLDRYFGIRSKVENKKLACYALVRTSKEDKLGSKTQNTFVSFNDKIDVKHVPFKTFFRRLESCITDKIIFDETGYSNKVDIALENIKRNDIVSVNKALSKYDLRLVNIERNVNCLLLSSISNEE